MMKKLRNIDKKALLSSIFAWYRSLVPFIGFLGLSLMSPDSTGIIAFTGWLAALLYMYFYIIRYKSSPLKINDILYSIATPVLLLLISIIRGTGGFWNYFIELTLIEVISVNIGLAATLIFKMREASKDEVIGVVILASIFIISSSLAIFLPFGSAWLFINKTSHPIFLYSIISVIGINIFDEFRFFLKVKDNKIILDDSYFNENFMILIGAILGWMAGVPLLSYIIRHFL